MWLPERSTSTSFDPRERGCAHRAHCALRTQPTVDEDQRLQAGALDARASRDEGRAPRAQAAAADGKAAQLGPLRRLFDAKERALIEHRRAEHLFSALRMLFVRRPFERERAIGELDALSGKLLDLYHRTAREQARGALQPIAATFAILRLRRLPRIATVVVIVEPLHLALIGRKPHVAFSLSSSAFLRSATIALSPGSMRFAASQSAIASLNSPHANHAAARRYHAFASFVGEQRGRPRGSRALACRALSASPRG